MLSVFLKKNQQSQSLLARVTSLLPTQSQNCRDTESLSLEREGLGGTTERA